MTHAIVPSDYQQTDTYYIVAHFHYVIFGGGVFAFFGGLVYWWPKVFGRLYPERVAKVVFWIMLVGFNLTFGPMHILGLNGMIRREYTYPEALGLTIWNQVATVGSFLIGVSVLVFAIGAVVSLARTRHLETDDPWDARTLEWMTACPPQALELRRGPHGPLARRVLAPQVRRGPRRAPRAGPGRRLGRARRTATGTRSTCRAPRTGRSWWRSACRCIAYGIIYSWWLVGAGALVIVVGLFAWAMEPSVAEEG